MEKTILLIVGMWNIADGAVSLVMPKLGHACIYDVGRWIRIVLGFLLIYIASSL